MRVVSKIMWGAPDVTPLVVSLIAFFPASHIRERGVALFHTPHGVHRRIQEDHRSVTATQRGGGIILILTPRVCDSKVGGDGPLLSGTSPVTGPEIHVFDGETIEVVKGHSHGKPTIDSDSRLR